MAEENKSVFVNINSKLPRELLCIIFEFLSFSDLKDAMLVCRYTVGVGDISKKIMESRYIGIFQIIDKIIDIGNLNLEFIDKLSLSENASNLVR